MPASLTHRVASLMTMGSDGETLCETLISSGVCEEVLYPYIAGQILQPTPVQLEAARAYKLGAYHGCLAPKQR